MTALRLRTISPADALPASSALQRKMSDVREQAYQDGYLAGQAAAIESQMQDQSRLSSHLVEAINDASLTNEAARRHVAQSLGPMIEALFRAIAPALGERGVAVEIARLAENAANRTPEAKPQIKCAEEVAETLRSVLDQRGIAAQICIDPALLPGEAEVRWDQGVDRLDIERCATEVGACISKHLSLQPSENDATSGGPNE